MKVLVTGSRRGINEAAVVQRLSALRVEHPDLEVIVGDAPQGADFFCAIACEALGIPYRVFKAKWRSGGKYNPLAGHDRNQAMVNEAPDRAIAFWNGTSTGTKDCMDRAFCAGIPIEVVHS